MSIKRKITVSREKSFWIILIIVVVTGFIVFFLENQYVAITQSFGPVSLGEGSPLSEIAIRLKCGSQDGSYPSEVSDIYCKILVKSLGPSINEVDFSVVIQGTDNRTLINCQSTVRDINSWFTSEGYCLDQAGKAYFALPRGDYTILIKKFGVPGPEVGFVVTKAIPPVFRGQLHIMSAFERQIRQRDDGTSLATFLAFLFIIPTMIVGLRSFLREGVQTTRTNVQELTSTSTTLALFAAVALLVAGAIIMNRGRSSRRRER